MATSVLGWKSKLTSSLAYAEDDEWFFSEAGEKNDGLQNDSYTSLSRSEIAQQLLEDIDSLVKQEDEDIFSHWYEDKIDLPIFDEVDPVLPAEELKPGIEQLGDFDEALGNADLTPPHSPKNTETGTFIVLDCDAGNTVQSPGETVTNFTLQRNFVVNPENYIILPENYTIEPVFDRENAPDANYLTAPSTPVPDLEKEMAVVDEVVRSTAQRLESNIWESEASSSQSSSAESFGSPGSGIVDEESDDPEWMPFLKPTGKSGRINRRSKPYGTECSQQDRWLRKKEQNKNAATRYRQKKKAEVSEIIEEERKLEEQKGKLEQRVSDIQMEIKYLKGLMRDLFKAKGLLMN